ncbi:MAG TPA: glycosyltransferase family 2 protein [Chloroflexota bacterium]|nr:glycosyltransferase family 2 protein [Chloroflexota bacterium]
MARLSVIIPAYNERATIDQIVERVRAIDIVSEVIVVDDCSQDGTRDALAALNWPNVRCLFHERNQGKGAAIRTGLTAVTGDLVIIQDADLEYDPGEYPRLVAPIESGEADIVYGSRFLGKPRHMRLSQLIGNRLLTFATNILYRTSLTDMETCYKVFPASIVPSLNLRANRYDFEPEITAKLLKLGLRIKEIPISYEARDKEAGKKIRWTDGFPALVALLKYRFVN